MIAISNGSALYLYFCYRLQFSKEALQRKGYIQKGGAVSKIIAGSAFSYINARQDLNRFICDVTLSRWEYQET